MQRKEIPDHDMKDDLTAMQRKEKAERRRQKLNKKIRNGVAKCVEVRHGVSAASIADLSRCCDLVENMDDEAFHWDVTVFDKLAPPELAIRFPVHTSVP